MVSLGAKVNVRDGARPTNPSCRYPALTTGTVARGWKTTAPYMDLQPTAIPGLKFGTIRLSGTSAQSRFHAVVGRGSSSSPSRRSHEAAARLAHRRLASPHFGAHLRVGFTRPAGQNDACPESHSLRRAWAAHPHRFLFVGTQDHLGNRASQGAPGSSSL